jgi:hypothetical protein
MAKKRTNVIPIIEDARHPNKYRMLLSMVDVIFADVAQPDQARSAYPLSHCMRELALTIRRSRWIERPPLPQERRSRRRFRQGQLYRLDRTR